MSGQKPVSIIHKFTTSMKRKPSATLFVLITAVILISPEILNAQSKVAFNSGVDLMSRYIWRGLNPGGSSPSIQPTLEMTAGSFTLGSWGAFSMSDGLTVQETDLYLSYAFREMLTFTITDYFLPDEAISNNNYFEYNKDKTGHVLEASLSFNGTEKIPFSLLAAINLWGADARKANGDLRHSTYFELGYNGKCQETDYSVFIGFTPDNPDSDKGETGYYGPYAGVINMGITVNREITVTDKFCLPVSTSFIINPQAENIFLVFGISF